MSSSEEMALSLLHVLLLNNCTYMLENCVSLLSNTHNTIQLISCCSPICVSESEQLGRPVRLNPSVWSCLARASHRGIAIISDQGFQKSLAAHLSAEPRMSTTLPLFWHLSSASKKQRIDASVKLVSSLEQFQSQFTLKAAPAASGSEDEDEDEDVISKSDGLDLLNAQDVSYSMRRLVRGLASPRESSRLGFSVALTEASGISFTFPLLLTVISIGD